MAIESKRRITLRKGDSEESSENLAPLPDGKSISDTNSSLVQQIRDEGASCGLSGQDKEEGWKAIEAIVATQHDSKTMSADASEESYETGYEKELRRRLEDIKNRVESRLTKATNEVDRLEKSNLTPYGTKIMIWMGWLCVTSLGWVFSWILSRVIQNDSPDSSGVINDIVALFVKSFADLNSLIIKTYPSFESYQWLVLFAGITMVMISILSYLNVRKLSGDIKVFENVLGMLSQVSLKPDFEQVRIEAESADINRNRAIWVIITIGFGLPGIGILLSSIESSYSLSMIILGYAIAAVAVGVMMLVIHMHYNDVQSDESAKAIPIWLFGSLRIFMLSLPGILLLGLLLHINDNYVAIVQSVIMFAIGAYLLIGTSILALGLIHNNIYKNERHWQKVKGHIDYRLRVLQGKMDTRKREQAEQIKLSRDIEQKENIRLAKYKRIYSSAYELGASARKQEMFANTFNRRASRAD